ncbi:uncharacterized protein LOC133524270 isoform X2 [Cydia pomonella]|uniref:uncharacterized protein LOC133524270 isoform X2 n=1 Tax=Cydia pomonella TaxID=82600 RepID=UPI002ADE941B|nr:uncharacterized protein LOC133524270 isoform X2 [Cydia pomonella]
MTRRKRTQRTFKLQKQQQTENGPRTAEGSQAEELQESSVIQPQECPLIHAKTPEVTSAPTTPTETLQVPTTEVRETEKDTLSTFVCLNTTTIEFQENAAITNPQQNSMDQDDDSSELDGSISSTQGEAASEAQLGSSSVDDAHSTPRDSPLNLAWDSPIKDNCQEQATPPNFRPITPDNLPLPVDEMLSPATQKQIRTTIWALFPNGPPPPPPVRPMRRPKKGDLPYIVYCSERSPVPSPKGLNIFRGDKYGITSNTNLDEDEQCSPGKIARRCPYSSTSTAKSAFNRQTNEISDRLQLYAKIDRLVGRTPKEQPGGCMKRSFSPLPSTSTDNETIMKNDKHFSESLYCDNYDIDEEEELPEVILDSNTVKKDKNRKDLSSPLVSKDINKEFNNYSDISIELNEDTYNNNNEIAIADEFREIDFDKLLPKEKLFYYSDEDEDVPTFFPLTPPSKPSNDLCATTSTNVVCVHDTCTTNLSNPTYTQANSVTCPVLRTSNKNATATETKHSDLVIEVPDVLEPINMSRHAPARAPSWNEDVQFVSEERIERPINSTVDNHDVQFVSRIPGSPPTSTRDIMSAAMTELQQYLSNLNNIYSKRRTKKKSKRTKSKANLCVPCNLENALAINDENTAPINNENASNVNNENAASSVNNMQQSDSLNGSSDSAQGKQIGECPICLDNLRKGSIASTNCGHVFCLDCIKQSLKTSNKRCPTCRKQLRGVGYHQVFL